MVISAALKPRGTPNDALLTARHYGKLALSQAVFSEYSAVIRRPKFERFLSLVRINEMLDLLAVGAHWIEPTESVTACRDPKDNAYLALASAAEADCIISGDAHLLTLRKWRGIDILLAAEFLSPERKEARLEAKVDAYMRQYHSDTREEIYLDLYRASARARLARWSPHDGIPNEHYPEPD